jgi:hypothetical protein
MRPGISLREDFDGEGLRRLSRQSKDAAQVRRPISTALFAGVCATWLNGFGKSSAFL